MSFLFNLNLVLKTNKPKEGRWVALKYHTEHTKIAIDKFVVRPQMRQTIDTEGIEELAENIYIHGLIHPVCAAYFPGEGYVVISGHRRLYACQLLAKDNRNIGDLPTIVFYDLSPIELALLQASENIHVQVPPQEAAEFYEATWSAIKAQKPEFTLRDFSRAIGRSESTVRNALRFALLPKNIKNFVKNELLTYGAAVEIGRLEVFVTTEEFIRFANNAVIANLKVSEVKERVNQRIKDIKAGQRNLSDMFTEAAQEEYYKSERRTLIDLKTATSFWHFTAYMEKLLQLFEENILGESDTPWLRRKPKEAFTRNIDVLEEVLEQLRPILEKEEQDRAEDVLIESRNLLKEK